MQDLTNNDEDDWTCRLSLELGINIVFVARFGEEQRNRVVFWAMCGNCVSCLRPERGKPLNFQERLFACAALYLKEPE